LPEAISPHTGLHGHIHGSWDEATPEHWQDKHVGNVVPAISEHWKDEPTMVMSLIGYGLTKAARTDLVASTGFEGLDLPRYRTAIQTAREHAVRAWSAGEAGGIADGDIAHND